MYWLRFFPMPNSKCWSVSVKPFMVNSQSIFSHQPALTHSLNSAAKSFHQVHLQIQDNLQASWKEPSLWWHHSSGTVSPREASLVLSVYTFRRLIYSLNLYSDFCDPLDHPRVAYNIKTSQCKTIKHPTVVHPHLNVIKIKIK